MADLTDKVEQMAKAELEKVLENKDFYSPDVVKAAQTRLDELNQALNNLPYDTRSKLVQMSENELKSMLDAKGMYNESTLLVAQEILNTKKKETSQANAGVAPPLGTAPSPKPTQSESAQPTTQVYYNNPPVNNNTPPARYSSSGRSGYFYVTLITTIALHVLTWFVGWVNLFGVHETGLTLFEFVKDSGEMIPPDSTGAGTFTFAGILLILGIACALGSVITSAIFCYKLFNDEVSAKTFGDWGMWLLAIMTVLAMLYVWTINSVFSSAFYGESMFELTFVPFLVLAGSLINVFFVIRKGDELCWSSGPRYSQSYSQSYTPGPAKAPEPQKSCEKCGKNYDASLNSCPWCGNRPGGSVPSKWYCVHCHSYNDATTVFCKYCGKAK